MSRLYNFTNRTLPDCADILDFNTFTHYTCIPSVVIIVILAFLERRRFRSDLFGGKPGLVIPLPLLDGYDNRFSFAAAFGAITTTILSLLLKLGQSLPFSFPLWATALVIQVQILEACLTCFPLFACIATRHKMVGAVLGLLYSTTLLIASIIDTIQTYCLIPPSVKVLQVLEVIDDIPIVLCYLYLILKSCHTMVVCCRTGKFTIREQIRRINPHQQQYTRLVLRKDYSPSLESSLSEKLIYKSIPGFKYPVRIISVTFILFALVYKLFVLLLLTGVQLVHTVEKRYSPMFYALNLNGTTIYLFTTTTFRLLTGVYFVVTCVAAAIAFFYVYLFMKSYRRHILRLFRGSKYFILDRLPNPQVMMANNLRFPGYQIAYMLWGFLILFLTLMITFVALTYVIYFLSVNHYLTTAVLSILQTLSFPLFALLLFYLQVILAKKVLMQDKVKVTDEHPPLNVDNRRFYEIFNYYSLFGSLAIGIFSCFWRILQGTILGVFLVGRLDHSIYSRGWEHRDKGYLSYISMLYVENSHNHPILRVFCDLLLELQSRSRTEQGDVNLVDIRHRPQPVGGAGGIGAACVRALLEKGAKAAVADNDEAKGAKLMQELRTLYGQNKVIFVKCDVTDPTNFRDAFDKAVTNFGHVDVMLNNAGVMNEPKWEKMLDVNLRGVIHGTKMALAHMRRDKGGQGGVIINVASVGGYHPFFVAPVYVASKHGIIGYTRSMACAPNIGRQGVRYACICPDVTDTPIIDDLPRRACSEYVDEALEITSAERLSPKVVAEGLLSLIADDDSNDKLLEVCAGGLIRKKMTVENA